MDIAVNMDAGRHAVAKRFIPAGELIAVETPAVACLEPESIGTYCTHSFEKCLNPLPSPLNSSDVFASAG